MTTPLNEGTVPAAVPADELDDDTIAPEHLRVADALDEIAKPLARGSASIVRRAAEMLRALATSAPPPVEAREPSQWRPIITAPKDGTEVLLAAPGRVTYGHWLKPSDIPRIKYQDGFAPEEEWDDFEPHWMSWDGGFTEEHPPTHWMPLPASPSPSNEREGK